MSDQVADVLDDAADLLERDGWIQGHETGPGGVCAMTAIAAASVDHIMVGRSIAAATEDALMGAVPGWENASVPAWNDDPGRTKQQVLDAFRAAAKQERMRPETPAPPRTAERDGAGAGLAGGDAETRTRPADESHPPR
jgi:hypothetical protein